MESRKFLRGRKLYKHQGELQHSASDELYDGRMEVTNEREATLVSSESIPGPHTLRVGGFTPKLHMPVLDIDFDAHLEPSTTPGHFHLYLNREITWDRYVTLLKALRDAGLIEPGFVKLSLARGATFVRMPGVIKGEDLSEGERQEQGERVE